MCSSPLSCEPQLAAILSPSGETGQKSYTLSFARATLGLKVLS